MRIAKIRENATIPQFQTSGAAGVDLHACISHSIMLFTPTFQFEIVEVDAINNKTDRDVAGFGTTGI